MSKNGPFKCYLKKIKITDNEWYRYCYTIPEIPVHLIYKCNHLNLELKENYNLEEISKCLIKKLIRDKELINHQIKLTYKLN